jgi:hypothetical protein
VDKLRAVLDIARTLLTGEPARAIGYGAAVVIYLVAKVVGVIPDQTFDQAVVEAVAAMAIVASVVETIRHYVYSPATVEYIVTELGNG